MTRSLWTYGRVLAPAIVLGALVWRLGTGPFLDGVRSVDGRALAVGTGIVALTTLGCAWRWTVVARGLGVELSLPSAVGAYYRSLFLNVTLPGGIVGDVHRGVSHGRAMRDVGRGLRSVVWERAAGQVVQVLLTVVVLLALPSPLQSAMPPVAIALAVATVAIVLLTRLRPDARSAWGRARSAAGSDIRDALLARRAWLGISLVSALVVAGYAITFIVAARSAGTTAPLLRLLPIALLAVMAMVLPNVGGWGPREGVAAWVFAAAGLGAGRGVATAVVYGVMVLVASLPGAALLLVAWLRGGRAAARKPPALREGATHA